MIIKNLFPKKEESSSLLPSKNSSTAEPTPQQQQKFNPHVQHKYSDYVNSFKKKIKNLKEMKNVDEKRSKQTELKLSTSSVMNNGARATESFHKSNEHTRPFSNPQEIIRTHQEIIRLPPGVIHHNSPDLLERMRQSGTYHHQHEQQHSSSINQNIQKYHNQIAHQEMIRSQKDGLHQNSPSSLDRMRPNFSSHQHSMPSQVMRTPQGEISHHPQGLLDRIGPNNSHDSLKYQPIPQSHFSSNGPHNHQTASTYKRPIYSDDLNENSENDQFKRIRQHAHIFPHGSYVEYRGINEHKYFWLNREIDFIFWLLQKLFQKKLQDEPTRLYLSNALRTMLAYWEKINFGSSEY